MYKSFSSYKEAYDFINDNELYEKMMKEKSILSIK
ncbi:hypothetical protein [Clostridium tertium]